MIHNLESVKALEDLVKREKVEAIQAEIQKINVVDHPKKEEILVHTIMKEEISIKYPKAQNFLSPI